MTKPWKFSPTAWPLRLNVCLLCPDVIAGDVIPVSTDVMYERSVVKKSSMEGAEEAGR